MKKLTKVLAAIAMAVSMVALSSCSMIFGNGLEGKTFECVTTESIEGMSGFSIAVTETLSFEKKGVFKVDIKAVLPDAALAAMAAAGVPQEMIDQMNYEESIEGTWSVDGDELTTVTSGVTNVSTYSLKKDTLTITSGSVTTTYTKVKK